MNRYMVMRILGLYLVHASVHYASLNEELTIFNVEVFPFQCPDLAYAKSQTLSDQNHCAVRLLQPGDNGLEAVASHNHGTLAAFSEVLYAHHLDRVATVVDQLPACRTLKQQVHHTADMCLGLRGHFQFLEPTLYRHRPNLTEYVITPPWLQMHVDV